MIAIMQRSALGDMTVLFDLHITHHPQVLPVRSRARKRARRKSERDLNLYHYDNDWFSFLRTSTTFSTGAWSSFADRTPSIASSLIMRSLLWFDEEQWSRTTGRWCVPRRCASVLISVQSPPNQLKYDVKRRNYGGRSALFTNKFYALPAFF